MILSVAVPVPLYKTFDYLAPISHIGQAGEVESDVLPVVGARVLVPFAGRELVGVILEVRESQQSSSSTAYKIKHAIRVLDASSCFPSALLGLLSWSSHYYCHPIGECLHTALPVALRKLRASVQSSHMQSVVKWHRTDQVFSCAKRAPRQAEVLSLFEGQAGGVWQDALKLFGVTVAQLGQLEKKGFIRKETFDPLSAEGLMKDADSCAPIALNAQQLDVVSALKKQADRFSISLLHGITGSGKTEVYIERVREVVAENKQALILIPEINLTPQTLSRFQSQLNSPVGLIHSGMSEKEKLTMWYLAKHGTAKVIIGTRSAIFTPFQSLALIVVDEEHDSSFKQNDGFKYSARDLAVKRGQLENCQVVLGSATPSLESLWNVEQKKYHYLSLSERAGAGEKPKVHLIDIKSRTLVNGCSELLLQKIQAELDKQNQVIIFQNRRGFSPTLLCNACGWIAQCPHCDARLTLHHRPHYLHCHHCDYKESVARACKSCGCEQLSPLGTGTERLELGLSQRFPDTEIIRIDRDSIKKQQDMKALVAKVNRGLPCILVGTQMLAKGHDFHNVTLVSIIDADASLFSADFRAFEHSTQLMLQVAGRAGRGNKKGEVLIQTKHAEHPLFQPILDNDYALAARLELQERQECALPPVSKMISIRAESTASSLNFEYLIEIRKRLDGYMNGRSGYLVSGPLEASMSRKAGVFRAYLHFFTTDNSARQEIQTNLPVILSALKGPVKVFVDVDPHEYA